MPSRSQTAVAVLALSACAAWAQPAADSGPSPRVIRGNDQVIAPAPAAAPLPQGPATNFRFEEASVRDVVQVVLGELLKVNFIMHPPVDGRVTIVTQTPVSNDDAVFLLESALQAIGLAIGRDVRGTYHVGRPEVIRSIVPAVRQASAHNPMPPGTGAIVVPLRFIGAAEMAAILRPMAPPDAIVRVDTLRNLLVLVGTRSQAEGWLSLVETFDVNLLKGMSVGFFPLRYAAVTEIEAALQLMSGASGAPAAAGAAQRAAPGSPGSLSAPAAAAAADRQPLFGAVRILPMERLNAVLVVSPRAEYIDEARRLIERMDRPGSSQADARLFVYPVRNGTAADLAEVLNGIFGGGAAASAGPSGVAPGLSQVAGTTARLGSTTSAGLAAPAVGGAAVSAAPTGAVSAVQINNNLRVVADPRKNALLIYASPFQYERIEDALKRLDVPPVQVLIEASIVEVTLTDEMQYGMQWLFTDSYSSGKTGTGVLSSLDGGDVGGPVAGFSYTLRSALGNIRAVLNAMADKSLLRVISTPSLMVLDNHTASIVVGNQQPIRSTETVTDGGTRSTSITYKDTGVSLAVTPSVNAGDMVTMHVNQAVTDVGAVDIATGQRSFLQRQIASRVAVKAGETLVLGGLIRDNASDGSNGVPGLHEIPVFGALFGTKSRNATRTELLVIITPRVVRSTEDAREVNREMRERMQGLQPPAPVAPPAPPIVAPGGPHS